MRRILILLLLLLAVGAYLRYGERRPEEPRPLSEPLGLQVPGAATETVQLVIELKLPGQPFRQLALRRHLVAGQAQWWLDAPHVRAEDEQAEAVYQALADTRVRRRLPGARRDPGYGLAGEGFRARALLKGSGPMQELRLGAEAPDGSVYGARDQQQDVLVLEPRLFELLQLDRSALTRMHMTAFALEPPQRLALGAVTLERRPSSWVVAERALPAAEAQWKAGEDEPPRPLPRGQDRPPARARAARVDELLQTLREARASEQLGGAGVPFRHTDLRVRPAPLPVLVNGAEQFFVGLPCPKAAAEPRGLLVRADGARLCFPEAVLRRATPSYDELREPRLVPFPAAEIGRLGLVDGELRRAGEGWTLRRGGAEQPADGEAVSAFIAELLALSGAPAGARGAAPAGAPGLTTAELRVGTPAGDALRLRALRGGLVQRDDEEPLRAAAAEAVLGAGALRFVARGLRRGALYDIRSLRLLRPEVTEELRRVGERGPVGERYRLRRGALELPVDAERAARLLAAVAELRAERFVPAQPGARLLGLQVEAEGAARFEAEVLAAGGRCLLRGPGVPAGALALLAEALCADLQAPLVSGALLLLDDARLLRVRLTGGAGAARALEGDAARQALPLLRRLTRGEPLAYGDPPAGPPLLELALELAPVPARGEPLADVPPERQRLSFYGPGARPRAALQGRPVLYRVPAEILQALLALLR